MSRVARNTQQIHDSWMDLWRMHACLEDLNWQVLRDLHQQLSKQEAELYGRTPKQCVAALRERLETARRVGLDLSMPEWASDMVTDAVHLATEQQS